MMRRAGYLLVPMLAAVALWAAEDQYGFMPDGGRSILSGLLSGLDRDAAVAVLSREADATGWAEWVAAAQPGLSDVAVQTFAGYAALNLPLAQNALADGQDLAAALPADGKDLAVAQCQFCHSLFSGYLMHERDRTGWEGTFKAPFHKEIPMTEVERQTFANYSALNMPLRYEDVPPELRF